MSIEAMKLALEAVQDLRGYRPDIDKAIEALRTAIQQAEAQQPATGEPVKAAPYNPTEEMRWAMKRIDPALSSDQCRALWSAAWSASPSTHPAPSAAVTPEPVVSRNPFASRCYTMSESHLSGHRLIVGFEKLGDAQDAHEWVARQGRGDFTHPAPSVPAAWTKDLFLVVHAMEMNNWNWKSSASNDLKREAHEAATRLYTASKVAAPSVPDDVVRAKERCRFILAAADDMTTSRYKSLCELLGVAITEDFDLGAAINAAMLAAK